MRHHSLWEHVVRMSGNVFSQGEALPFHLEPNETEMFCVEYKWDKTSISMDVSGDSIA